MNFSSEKTAVCSTKKGQKNISFPKWGQMFL